LARKFFSLAHLWASPIVKHEAKVIMKLNIRRSQRPNEGEGSYAYSLRVERILCLLYPSSFLGGFRVYEFKVPFKYT
jgi:hypothetical protein